MKVIIDRFEGEYAVVEYTDATGEEGFARISAVLLPGVTEGDVVEISVCPEDTAARRDKIKNLMNSLFEEA